MASIMDQIRRMLGMSSPARTDGGGRSGRWWAPGERGEGARVEGSERGERWWAPGERGEGARVEGSERGERWWAPGERGEGAAAEREGGRWWAPGERPGPAPAEREGGRWWAPGERPGPSRELEPERWWAPGEGGPHSPEEGLAALSRELGEAYPDLSAEERVDRFVRLYYEGGAEHLAAGSTLLQGGFTDAVRVDADIDADDAFALADFDAEAGLPDQDIDVGDERPGPIDHDLT